jgi:hypothetical protein
LKFLALGTAGDNGPDWDGQIAHLSSVAPGGRALCLDVAPVGGALGANVGMLLWTSSEKLVDATDLTARNDRMFWRSVVALEEHVVVEAGGYLDRSLLRLGLMRRRPELSRAEFFEHWVGGHAPLVLAHEPLFTRYVLNRIVGDVGPVDGVVEQQFADRDTWQEHDRLVREEKPDVLRDVAMFISGGDQYAAQLVRRWQM